MKGMACGLIWVSVLIQSSWGKYFTAMPDLPLVVTMLFVFHFFRRTSFYPSKNWIDIFYVLAWAGCMSGLYSMSSVEEFMGLYFAVGGLLYIWQKSPWAKFRASDIGLVILAGAGFYAGMALIHQSLSALVWTKIITISFFNGVTFMALRFLGFDRKHKKELRFAR